MADKLTRETIEEMRRLAEDGQFFSAKGYHTIIALCDMALSPSPALTAAREALEAITSEMAAGLGSSYGETREQVRRALALLKEPQARPNTEQEG